MSLEWAERVQVSATDAHLDVSRVPKSGGTRLVIRSAFGAEGAVVIDMPARQGPALRDILMAMYPRAAGK